MKRRSRLPPSPGHQDVGPIVTLGIFDGVHLGHRALLRSTVAWAREIGTRSVVLTFDPHPALVLSGRAPASILPMEERLDLFEAEGIDETVVVPFDSSLAETPAGTFARRVFRDAFGACGLLLGYDARFGKDRMGSARFLRSPDSPISIDVREADPVLLDGIPVKSSRVRRAITAGDLSIAARLLDRPAVAVGTVIEGEKRGRKIGHPTANLSPAHSCLPPPGVYATRTRRGDLGGSPHPSVTNIGSRPTFDPAGSPLSIETHILDFEGDLYGERLLVEFLGKIRDEVRFDGPEALAEQITRDREQARGWDDPVGEPR